MKAMNTIYTNFAKRFAVVLTLLTFGLTSAWAATETATLTFDDIAKQTALSSDQQVWEENGIKFINNQGKKDETVLTYLARYYCDCHKLIDVSLNNFMPKPNIESMVIKFNKKEYPLKVKDDKKFLNVTKALLKMRRKTIQNNLNAYLPSKNDVIEVLNALNIDPLTRPESLS